MGTASRWHVRDLAAALRPPRRLRVRRAGAVLCAFTLLLGLAALNTGNNLLYLLLGALLGLLGLSGWLSEQALRGLDVERRLPRAVTAGRPARIAYTISNRKRRMPTCTLEVREAVAAVPAFASIIEPGGTAAAATVLTPPRRGVWALDRIVIGTAFPFGLFVKERDIHVPGTLVVWPRTDRAVRRPRGVGTGTLPVHAAGAAATGAERAQFRGLRPYRAGDDPRDVHWRSSARLREPVVREWEREVGAQYWICLDGRAPTEGTGEDLVEVAAAVAARAAQGGDRFGFAAGGDVVAPGTGPAQLEAVLDLLARVGVGPAAPRLRMPAPPGSCVLIATHAGAGGWADVFGPEAGQ
jgi:uncharacterized protein (DUF58 family)